MASMSPCSLSVMLIPSLPDAPLLARITHTQLPLHHAGCLPGPSARKSKHRQHLTSNDMGTR